MENTHLTHVSKNPAVYGEIETYIPAIFVINADKADPSKMPIIGTGVMVNEDLPGMEEFEDNIIVWYFDESTGEFVEGLMDEETVLATTHPVFMIDNACEELTIMPKQTIHSKGEVVTPRSGTNPEERFYLSSYEYQINSRNEGSGKSEFCVSGYIIDEDGDHGSISRNENYTANDYHLIAKVPKDAIGVEQSKWVTFARPRDIYISDFAPFQYTYVFWNSFERDGCRSKKPLIDANGNNIHVSIEGKMHFYSDWYAFNPTETNNNRLDLETIFNQWSKTYSNDNGKLTIWRIDF